MTEKQERFIDEYIIDFNATRAAIAAGYSSKRANSQGVHLLSIPEIQAEARRKSLRDYEFPPNEYCGKWRHLDFPTFLIMLKS